MNGACKTGNCPVSEQHMDVKTQDVTLHYGGLHTVHLGYTKLKKMVFINKLNLVYHNFIL